MNEEAIVEAERGPIGSRRRSGEETPTDSNATDMEEYGVGVVDVGRPPRRPRGGAVDGGTGSIGEEMLLVSGVGCGSRRRRGSETPTDSNATDWWDQEEPVGSKGGGYRWMVWNAVALGCGEEAGRGTRSRWPRPTGRRRCP